MIIGIVLSCKNKIGWDSFIFDKLFLWLIYIFDSFVARNFSTGWTSFKELSEFAFFVIRANMCKIAYNETSSKRRTESKHLNVSRLVLQLSLSNPLKPGVKKRMEM